MIIDMFIWYGYPKDIFNPLLHIFKAETKDAFYYFLLKMWGEVLKDRKREREKVASCDRKVKSIVPTIDIAVES